MTSEIPAIKKSQTCPSVPFFRLPLFLQSKSKLKYLNDSSIDDSLEGAESKNK